MASESARSWRGKAGVEAGVWVMWWSVDAAVVGGEARRGKRALLGV